ncbi:hypothetical protein ES703_08693 [subsurface metagenome]
MPKIVRFYVRFIDAMSQRVGKVVRYGVLAMIGILLFETVSRTVFDSPRAWTVELSQFVMASYYILGGSCALLMGGHVRMDLLYERWSAKRRAIVDAITVSVAIVYIGIFILGGINSAMYALRYGQITYSPWGPPLAPIKIIFVLGATMMLLQIIANFFRDLAIARGKPIT